MTRLSSEEITRFPPIVQIVGLVLLSIYVLASIIGRLSPRFRWMWRDPRKRNRLGHIVEYTLIPAFVLAALSAGVVYNWDYRIPLRGGWALTDLMLGPGAALLGGLLIVAATALGHDVDEKDPAALRSWLPFILVIAGIALMAAGIFRFGRVVKQRPAEIQLKTSLRAWAGYASGMESGALETMDLLAELVENRTGGGTEVRRRTRRHTHCRGTCSPRVRGVDQGRTLQEVRDEADGIRGLQDDRSGVI